LTLPRRQPRAEDTAVAFAPPEGSPRTPRRILEPAAVHRRISYDVGSGEQDIEVLRDDGRSVIEEIGVETAFRHTIRYRLRPDAPPTARAAIEHDIRHGHDAGWDTRIVTHCAISCTDSEFVVEAALSAYEGEIRRFSRSWTERIARDLG